MTLRMAVLMALFAASVAGCVAQDDVSACREGRSDVEVRPEATDLIVNHDTIAVRSGMPVTLHIDLGPCVAPPEFRWHVEDWRSVPSPIPGAEQGLGAGLPSHRFVTEVPETTMTFDHVGAYVVWTDFLYDDAVVNMSGYAVLRVNVYFVHEGDLPDDGSPYTAEFTAFCCPAANSVDVRQEAGGVAGGPRWLATYSVAATGQIIWQGVALSAPDNVWTDALGETWLEEIRVAVEADELATPPAELRGTYRVEMRFGPTSNYIDDV